MKEVQELEEETDLCVARSILTSEDLEDQHQKASWQHNLLYVHLAEECIQKPNVVFEEELPPENPAAENSWDDVTKGPTPSYRWEEQQRNCECYGSQQMELIDRQVRGGYFRRRNCRNGYNCCKRISRG